MRFVPFALATFALFAAVPSSAAVDLEQKANAFDRFFERLPDLRLVRGATPKTTTLVVTAEAGEAWTITTEGDWLEVTPASGTGPAEVTLRFDAALLNTLEDPTGSITITGAVDPGTNTETIAVNWNIWPNLVEANTRAELIAYAKDPANWPLDGFGGSYELWGFLPDETTHGAGAGALMDQWERTPCAPGEEDSDACVRAGQAGLAAGQSADQAWLLSTGDPRIVIGELDSGIRWSERNLVTKYYLNARELGACPPPGGAERLAGGLDPFDAFDVNGDGLFNMRDYDDATFVTDVNQNGLRDPQDLIWSTGPDGTLCSDGVDVDGNGYVDDISGWDFFWNDNDASDDTDFGHGTGEALDSTGEAHDGEGTPGVCPRCLVLPVRVGDSFVVDVNQFADGVIFTVESGAHVVQEALGSLNNTPYAQAAINWAYDNNVPIIASAADETSYHHNYPGSLEHTIYVHAITYDDDGENNPETASTFLNFNNCTNFGGHLSLSTPGSGCSSEATGKTAGQTGLLMSYFLQQKDSASSPADEAYFEEPLSAEEVYQVLVASADDIDVPGAEKDPAALDLQKFPSNEGWDLHFGYGRNNARRSLEIIRDRAIPPEVDVTSPRWFEVFDPNRTSSFEVKGTVRSTRVEDLRWELHVAEGAVGKLFTKVAEGSGPLEGTSSTDGAVVGTVDLSRSGPLAALVARAGDPAGGDPEQFTATLELRVFGKSTSGGADVRGIFRKTFGVRADPATHDGFPIFLGASGESSPKLTDLDGDGAEEIVMATADGFVHAFDRTGAEIPGFPVALATYASLSTEVCAAEPRKCYRNARPFATGAIPPDSVHQSVISSLAVGDLDNDGGLCRDIVVSSTDGLVFAFDCTGEVKDGFPVEIDRSKLPDGLQGARRCTNDAGVEIIGCRSEQQFGESGFFSSPLLADLNGDGDLELVVAGLDSWLYAWHHDATEVNGFPVHIDHPSEPVFDDEGNINRLVDRIISSPTVANVFGDGTPVLFVGSNERIENSGKAFLYAIWPDGNAHAGGAFPPNWPVSVNGFISDEILPFVGRGNPNSPASGDLDGDGDDEVVNAGMGGTMYAFDGSGEVAVAGGADMAMRFTSDAYGENATSDEEFSLPVINNPSIADLDGDGLMEIVNGTAGSGLIAVASAGGLRSEYDHSVSAWVAGSGYFQAGFPQKVADYQFFMNYAVADLEGTGRHNVVSGDGGYFVWAPNVDGKSAAGFPKWTQGWHITTPAIGDLDGDELIDVVIATREGWLWAWKTAGHVGGPPGAAVPAIQWEGFHHDDHNTGNANPATLKAYPKLAPPNDGCAEGGCCCTQSSMAGPRATPLTGALAFAFVAGTLVIGRRRRAGRNA
jgi:hypothetical protein